MSCLLLKPHSTHTASVWRALYSLYCCGLHIALVSTGTGSRPRSPSPSARCISTARSRPEPAPSCSYALSFPLVARGSSDLSLCKRPAHCAPSIRAIGSLAHFGKEHVSCVKRCGDGLAGSNLSDASN
mmetsp:Transcript_31652/g.96878  ORF Transcript_31652/g.96878 Transcript_31652/m.96878 type:complete len:128 (+) Transcript_31652:1823-2206(+)